MSNQTNQIDVSVVGSNGWEFSVKGNSENLQLNIPSTSNIVTMENLVTFKTLFDEMVSKSLDQSIGLEDIDEDIEDSAYEDIEDDVDFVGPCYAQQGV